MGGYDPGAELMSDRRAFRAEMTAARLEIARLQVEVGRLANELEASERGSLGRKLQRDIAQVQRDRAWNDAMEAAADWCETRTMEIPMNREARIYAEMYCAGEPIGGVHEGKGYASAIRALKRT